MIKIDNILKIRIDGLHIQRLYTSFMFHINNPDYKMLIEIYSQLEDALDADK